MTRAADPQFTFADLEFIHQDIQLDIILQTISEFIDQHDEVRELVRKDLERGLKIPGTGRSGLTAQQTLRSFVLMRVKNWDYRELRERIADGYTLRRFTHFNSKAVPKHDAFNRAHNRIAPATLRTINDLVVRAAVSLDIEDGSKLRVDTTVVEADIHHPTDSSLLWDTVRVVTRLVERLRELLPEAIPFTRRTRSARRRMQAIERMTARERQQGLKAKYHELIGIAEQVLPNAERVVQAASAVQVDDLMTAMAIDGLRTEIGRYCALGVRVIDQARRRVLQGEQVPAQEKIYSIFEPHTDVIKRGKVDKPVEFGHKVFLAESANGLITDYRVLDGNPPDENHVKPSLQSHEATFGRAPELYGADRGFYSTANVDECRQAGVAIVSIPQRGGKKSPDQESHEKSPAFKKGQRFRSGIEGRISVLFRGRGMKRCRLQGREHFELLIGAAVLANNLMRIAELLRKRAARRKRAA
jgi:IS5 family transposase